MDEFPPDLDLAAHPNDAFFKAVFSEPEHAIAFFKKHLPSGISARIDWDTLKVIPTSFVKTNLQQVHSDLLFSVKLGGHEFLLYLLFEHQTQPDPLMPLRILGYILEILRKHHQRHGLPLPPVFPIVLHQGPENWNVSTAFEDLFDLPEELAADLLPFIPKFHHALLDLSRYDPDTGEDDIRQRVVLQLMKLARERQLLEFFQWLAKSIAGQIPDSLLGRLLLYALHADSELDAEQIFHRLSSNPELEQRTMSVAEKLIAKGRMEGISQGLTQGITQGISQGRAEGLWIGKIQALEEFLEKPQSSREALESLALPELESLHQALHREYEIRFKRN
ncbi:MAG: Rpn family recombination-promoting nuclease/putative transposase [Akkermansiaceae bacterium]